MVQEQGYQYTWKTHTVTFLNGITNYILCGRPRYSFEDNNGQIYNIIEQKIFEIEDQFDQTDVHNQKLKRELTIRPINLNLNEYN